MKHQLVNLSSSTQTMVLLKDIVTNMWKYFWEIKCLQDDRDICGGAKGVIFGRRQRNHVTGEVGGLTADRHKCL